MRRVNLVYVGFVMCVGCAAPTVPDDVAQAESTDHPAPSTNQGNATVRLIEPSDNSLMSQNDSTIGCTAHHTRGYGFRIEFSWAVVGDADVSGYNLHVKHVGSQFPWLDILVQTDTHAETSCNSFIADHNLEDWHWRVRALDPDGAWGPWSETRVFHFEACRHADGRPCTAPG